MYSVTRSVCKKIAQNVAQAVYGQNLTAEISSPIIWAFSVTCKKLPKVSSHPIGENLPIGSPCDTHYINTNIDSENNIEVCRYTE
jgi:hypothetical protein